MSVFGENYSESYDKIYQQKNYHDEVEYLKAFFADHALSSPLSILDLGCGTGEHAIRLAREGNHIVGLDQSEPMLKKARKKFLDENLSAEFQQTDITEFALKEKFDVAIAMFAVLGYVTDNHRLLQTLKNIYNHLKPNGLFMFDCWHGNAVLHDKPMPRQVQFELDGKLVTRTSHTTIDIENNIGKVDFSIKFNDGVLVEESHQMRYFFMPELELLLNLAGFSRVDFYRFLSKNKPVVSDWNLFVLAGK